MTDDTTNLLKYFIFGTQSKTYCFSENDNSQYIVSDDTKIKTPQWLYRKQIYFAQSKTISQT